MPCVCLAGWRTKLFICVNCDAVADEYPEGEHATANSDSAVNLHGNRYLYADQYANGYEDGNPGEYGDGYQDLYRYEDSHKYPR